MTEYRNVAIVLNWPAALRYRAKKLYDYDESIFLGIFMYALVMVICYLNNGCEQLYLDGFDTEDQCLYEMRVQRIRDGGCLPIDDIFDDFWIPARSHYE